MVAAEEFLLEKVEETIELEMKGNPEFTPAQLAKKVLERRLIIMLTKCG